MQRSTTIQIDGSDVPIESPAAIAEIRRVMLTTSTTAHQFARRLKISQERLNSLYAGCTTEAERREARAKKVKRQLPPDMQDVGAQLSAVRRAMKAGELVIAQDAGHAYGRRRASEFSAALGERQAG